MDFRISELQMRPLTQALEDRLARLEDRMQDQHEEIALLRGQICRCAPQGNPLVKLLISERLTRAFSSTSFVAERQFVFRGRGEVGVGLR